MHPSSASIREEYLDIAKGISILLIIIAHSGANLFMGYDHYFTSFYIPLFFIVSGYLYNKSGDFLEFIKKRVKRLCKPYFLYSIILFIAFIPYLYFNKKLNTSSCLHSLFGILYSRYSLYYPAGSDNNIYFMTSANSPLWFLTALMISCIIFYFVIESCLSKKWLLMSTILVLYLITCSLSTLPVLLPWSIDTSFLGTIFMIIGYLIKQYHILEKLQSINKGLSLLFLCIIYIFLCHLNPGINISIREYGPHAYLSILYCILIGLSGTIACLIVSQYLCGHFAGSILSFFGKSSITILALHTIIYTYIDYFFSSILKMNIQPHTSYFYPYSISKIIFTALLCLWIAQKPLLFITHYVNIIKNHLRFSEDHHDSRRTK